MKTLSEIAAYHAEATQLLREQVQDMYDDLKFSVIEQIPEDTDEEDFLELCNSVFVHIDDAQEKLYANT